MKWWLLRWMLLVAGSIGFAECGRGIARGADAQPASLATRYVLLVTLDGYRWQELFTGADMRLMTKDSGKVADETALRERFWRETPEARRAAITPFFWNTIAQQGQVFGDPAHNSSAQVTNGHFFSYPGYNELLCGFGDPSVDSNDKKLNQNVTVLEFLHRLHGHTIAAFTSWDVFPYIINQERSGIPVNAGWQPLAGTSAALELEMLDRVAAELPQMWPSVRYDYFTWRGAMGAIQVAQPPEVLYVSLGETDDWAHEGRYDLYLDSALRNDRYIAGLWQAAQNHPLMAGHTTLVLTTDHGRGDGREGWQSHGVDHPGSDRIWIAVMGPDTPALGLVRDVHVTQSQVAATVGALLGRDFRRVDARIAEPLPGVISVRTAAEDVQQTP